MHGLFQRRLNPSTTEKYKLLGPKLVVSRHSIARYSFAYYVPRYENRYGKSESFRNVARIATAERRGTLYIPVALL
jgi:hypothetical protein